MYPQNMPPKNMISVMRNTHIPMTEASICWCMEEKWCCRAGLWVATAGVLSLNGDLLVQFVVVVRFPRNGRSLVKVEGLGRRFDHPLQSSRVPGVRFGRLAIAHGPQQVNHGEDVADGQNCRACGGQHV